MALQTGQAIVPRVTIVSDNIKFYVVKMFNLATLSEKQRKRISK